MKKFLLATLVVILCGVGWTQYVDSNKGEEVTDVVELGDGLPNVVINDEYDTFEIYERDIEKVKNVLQAQPEILLSTLQNVSYIEIQDFLKSEDSSIKTVKAYVITSSDIGTVLHLNCNNFTKRSPDNSFKTTLTHELGHVYDGCYFDENAGDWKYKTSDSQEWLDMFNNNRNGVTQYGATNPQEYFAEAVMMYFWHPEDLEGSAPEAYNWLNNEFGEYK